VSKTRRNLILMFLALGQGAVYFLPYIRNVYYTPMLEIMNVTNAQFGSLVSFFAIGCMILYIPGGIITDRWNYKKCITYSLFATSFLVASFAFFLNFAYARIVFFLMALTTTFVFWTATLKAVRVIGKSDEQGRTFGFYYSVQGLLSILVQSGYLFMFNRFADPATGLKFVLIANAVTTFAAGIGAHFLLEEPSQETSMASTGGFDFKSIGAVIRNPLTWIIAILVFCAYGTYSNSYYFTVFLTSQRGLDPKIGAQLSLIRVTYMMCIASYIGGNLADRIGSTSKMYTISATIAAISGFAFVGMMNSDVSAMALGVLSILPSAFMLLVYGIISSLYEEYSYPVRATGTAIGIVSILGYTPDLIFGPLLGGWIDTQGAAGYTTIFTFFAILCLVGAGAAFVGKALNSKAKSSGNSAGELKAS